MLTFEKRPCSSDANELTIRRLSSVARVKRHWPPVMYTRHGISRLISRRQKNFKLTDSNPRTILNLNNAHYKTLGARLTTRVMHVRSLFRSSWRPPISGTDSCVGMRPRMRSNTSERPLADRESVIPLFSSNSTL